MSGELDQLKMDFGRELNRHGYAFQYAALTLADQLSISNRSDWIFELAEAPVEVRGEGTRIDCVLRHKRSSILMIVECKRANPALSNWVFVRAPYVRKDHYSRTIILEALTPIHQHHYGLNAKSHLFNHTKESYDLALEVKTRQPGDESGGKRDAIESAASQVIRGVNGYVNFARNKPNIPNHRHGAYLLPVILTTAKLYSSNVDLTQTDFQSGEVDISDTVLSPEPWLLYRYQSSPGTKHEAGNMHDPELLAEIMEAEYARTIAVASPHGFASFLEWAGALPL